MLKKIQINAWTQSSQQNIVQRITLPPSFLNKFVAIAFPGKQHTHLIGHRF